MASSLVLKAFKPRHKETIIALGHAVLFGHCQGIGH